RRVFVQAEDGIRAVHVTGVQTCALPISLQTQVTNQYVVGEPGSNGPGPNDAKVNNLDNLHYVSGPGFPPIYGGHPNPIRANPLNAGLHYYTTEHHFELQPTVDWAPVGPSMVQPVEGSYRHPVATD